MDYADVAYYIGDFIVETYFDRLADRFGLTDRPADAGELVEAIGRRRGCLGRAGIVDIDRASKIFVTELRAGKLGPLTLESPEMMERELVVTAKRIAEKEAAKEANSRKRKAAFREKKKERKAGGKRKR